MAKIGVLILDKYIDRTTTKEICFDMHPNVGLNAILGELKQPYEYCHASDVDDYDFVLCSITSFMDIENLIYSLERFTPDHRCKIIVGGSGVINIKLYSSLIDIAVFGRGEGQINKIIAGQEFNNVWRKENDPNFKKTYYLRQTQYLVPGEINVGCRNKCFYCQYTWTRKKFNDVNNYATGTTLPIPEDDWNGIKINKPGGYITALDGLSETTRKRVNKHITDTDILNKINDIYNQQLQEAVILKIYQIIGYPWETKESILNDLAALGKLLQNADRRTGKTKIFMMFMVTPFIAEPLTPMQYDLVNIIDNWGEILKNRLNIYKGVDIHSSVLPQINSPYTSFKRMFINRAEPDELELFKRIIFCSEFEKMPDKYKMPWLFKYGHVKPKLYQETNKSNSPFGYLNTYVGLG
jgi:hypothetical protein